ncbi:MAG: FAD-dependent oxidoreductase [Ignavibacteriaceae bacterium]
MIKPGKIIIVGGNAAGPAAAAKAKRVNPDAEVILFEAGNYISTGTCELPYVLSGDINNVNNIIFFTPEEFYREKGVKVYINHFVEDISKNDRIIKVRNLVNNEIREFNYDKLVLATGSKPKKLKDFPDNFKNVFYLKTVTDLNKINEQVKTKEIKNVVIIGSGYIGLEAAEAFKKLKINVTVLEKEDLPMPAADIEIRSLIRELLNQNDISFYGNAANMKVISDDHEIKSINLDSRLLEFDLIILAVGFLPNNELGKKLGLETGKSGALKVDYRLKTSCQHIFAAGDNVEITNAVTGRPDYMPLATIARDFGHIAGENAAGGNKYADSVVKNLAVKIFDKYFVNVGLSSLEAKKANYLFDSVDAVVPNLIEVMPGSEKVFGKIIFEKRTKRILGASFFGGKETAGFGDIISLMIRTKQSADALASVNYNYTPPLSPFVNLLSVLGRKILSS